ncbi:hypothetical protein [Roseobacter sp. TSBP12]|uniref:hypothetical protein n=1 Tax=Roseobacter sp. TSBP12 TaxID=1236613 RepID=UPI00125F5510|nr:hypothetical protein [Roseobacter sp. TSBP12]
MDDFKMFNSMLAEARQKYCAPEVGAQGRKERPAGIGHNAGPELAKRPEPFGLRAAWLGFANEMELRRLAKLERRIERKKQALQVLVGERQLIMRRCIRRMRRNANKN